MPETLEGFSPEFLSDVPERTLPFLGEDEKRWLSLWFVNEQDYLSNRMTPVKGFIDLAVRGMKESDETSRQDLEKALQGSEEIKTHYFIRGKVLVDMFSPSSCNKISGEVGSIFREAKRILPDEILELVEIESGELKIPASFDQKQMGWALAELVRNASQAIARKKEGGRVSVGFKAIEDGVVISVADNGWGIDEEVSEALEKSPSKLDKTQFVGRTSPGPGFGLLIAKTAAENHGGKVTFRARADEGSIFSITIPSGKETVQ